MGAQAAASGARKGGGTATATRGGTTGNATSGRSGGTGRSGAGARNGGVARQTGRGPVAAEAAAPESGPAPWLQIATVLLSVAGLGVSIYLTVAHFTESQLAGCSESGLVNCTKVTTSPQSYVFGIPVAVLGLAFYLFLAVANSPWVWRMTWPPIR